MGSKRGQERLFCHDPVPPVLLAPVPPNTRSSRPYSVSLNGLNRARRFTVTKKMQPV